MDASLGLKALITKADAEMAALPSDRRQFLNDNLAAKFMLHLNESLHAVAQAMSALPDRRAASEYLAVAAHALTDMRAALREAEHDRFSGWYDSEHSFGIASLAERIHKAQAGLPN